MHQNLCECSAQQSFTPDKREAAPAFWPIQSSQLSSS